jgi:hypothetical protein
VGTRLCLAALLSQRDTHAAARLFDDCQCENLLYSIEHRDALANEARHAHLYRWLAGAELAHADIVAKCIDIERWRWTVCASLAWATTTPPP